MSPTTPFQSVKELIAYAKQNPGKLSNASSSNGSPGHVGGELFKFMTGTDIVHVPYKGGAPAINDLIAGRVQLMFESLNSIAPFARSGAVRALAVTGDHRSPAFPLLPTVAEAGVPGYSAPTWSGVIAPAGLPQPIVDKLNAAINRAIQSGEFQARFAAIGDEPAGGTPEAFGALIASDSKKWGEVIAAGGDQVRVGRTFIATGLGTYCGHGAEAPRSGKAFEERPGQADPRQSGPAGCASARRFACRPAQSRHRPGHRRTGLADRAAATARQFVGPPRRFRQCASRPRLGGARVRRGAAAGLYRQKPK